VKGLVPLSGFQGVRLVVLLGEFIHKALLVLNGRFLGGRAHLKYGVDDLVRGIPEGNQEQHLWPGEPLIPLLPVDQIEGDEGGLTQNDQGALLFLFSFLRLSCVQLGCVLENHIPCSNGRKRKQKG